MLDITAMNSEETRYLSEVRTLWQTVGPLMRRKAALVGGMQWKTVGGREYLYRYQPDPVTRKKRSTSIGPRSPETEAAHAEFHASREQVRTELAEVMPKLDTFARMGKALRLNRIPEPVADILEALQEDGLLELAPLAGEYATRAFEVHYRQSYDFALPVDWPREIQFMVPDEMDLVRALTRAFLRVDSDYRMEDDGVLRGIEGPAIRLTPQSELVLMAGNTLLGEHFDLFLSMLELEPTVEVVVSRSGRPVQVAAVDPALWGAMFAMDHGDELLASAIAGRNAEFEEASGGLLGEMIGLLADAPTRRNGTPPSRISHYGWFSSHKDGSMIPTKGTLAAPFLELVHMQPEIRRVDLEPDTILFWSGKGWERYRAMYGIVRKGRRGAVDRTVDVEVLTDLELARDKAKWKRIRQAYRQNNRTLLIFTNHAILAEPRLTNAMIVNTQAGAGLIPRPDLEAVLMATQGSLTFTLNEVVAKGVLSYEQAYGAVLNMVASGEFSFATNRLFDGDTPVSRRR